MKDVALYNIQKDEYGYSIYWGRHTRIETGSTRLSDVRKRRVEIIALSRLVTYYAEHGRHIVHDTFVWNMLDSCVRTDARYVGRTIDNLDKIVETVKANFRY